jgi:4-hydroxybenzoate polyprenyltransferase
MTHDTGSQTPVLAELLLRARVVLAVARPPVMGLLAGYAATGFAAAGGNPHSPLALLPALAVVAGFLVFSVSVNDLADVEIDRINLVGHHNRPLVLGLARRRELIVTAIAGAFLALGAAFAIGWPAFLVSLVGLAISAAYSLPPIRLAGRGAVASLMLPACYVTVPFLTGMALTSQRIGMANLVMLAGLYVGFVGRILLKDFRDVRGDALFGKRTFLVRHGRKATCRFAAVGWIAGSTLVLTAKAMAGHSAVSLDLAYAAALIGVLALLSALAVDRGPRRDELLISAIAIVGRGQLLALLVTLSMVRAPVALLSAAVAAVAIVTAGQAHEMVRRGPLMRSTVPTEWLRHHATHLEPLPRRLASPAVTSRYSLGPSAAAQSPLSAYSA